MKYVVDDIRGAVIGAPVEEKKFPWGLLIIGIAVAGTIAGTMIASKKV